MFAERIQQTAFTDPDVSGVFKISGDTVYDAVLMSVLRAILPARIGEDSLYVKYIENDLSISTCSDYDDSTILNHIYGAVPTSPNSFTVVNMLRQNELHEKTYKGFVDKFEGWKREDRFTKFFKSFETILFTNEEKRSAILIVGRLNIVQMHYVTCAIPAIFPWYFPKEKKISDKERALLMSLRENRSTKFIEALKAFEEDFDFYTIKLESLNGFESEWMVDELNNVKREIESVKNRIADHQREIDEYLRNLEEKEIKCVGLETKIGGEADAELREFFIENKQRCRLTKRERGSLTFEIMSVLTYWDEEMAQTLYDNKRSVIYTQRGDRPRMKSEDFAELFKAIFIDQKFKLKLCAAYNMNTSDREVYGKANFQYGSECSNYLPNYHIERYSCLGGYRSVLNEMMVNHNYLGILEQCVVSCQSFNLMDSTVLDEFCKRFYAADMKCITLPDGTDVTPCDAVKWLKGTDADEKEEEENGETDENE